MATLKDISKQLGLSVTTVSRALNGFPEVRESTRRRVAEAAEALNYRPNQLARKLVSGNSGMVGLLLHSHRQLSYYGHFFEIVSSLSASFLARDVDLVLNVSPGEDPEALYRRIIHHGTIDGFIITGPEVGDRRIELLRSLEIPFIVHGSTPGGSIEHGYFDIDNHGLAFESVRYLAGLGHRRIALLNAPERLTFAAERLRGYREAHETLGLPFEPARILHGTDTAEYGKLRTRSLLDLGPEAPTAILCCNTIVAQGVYEALALAGKAVPDDISVMAHDDGLPMALPSSFQPSLTVTSSPLRDASEPLADLLLRAIAGEAPESLRVIQSAALRIGKSTAAPRT